MDPPVDEEHLTQLLDWSKENNKKIKTLIFLQNINNITSNIGNLSQFLGLYLPSGSPVLKRWSTCFTTACSRREILIPEN